MDELVDSALGETQDEQSTGSTTSTLSRQTRVRVSCRLDRDEYERVAYRAQVRGLSVSEYMRYALDKVVAVELGEIDVPDILVQRMNQVIDMLASQSKDLQNFGDMVVDGFNQIIGLTRGDNYLLEDDSGELY